MEEYTSISDRVIRKLHQLPMSPDLKDPLLTLIRIDTKKITQGKQWGWVIPSLYTILQGSKNIIPFSDAWLLFYAASIWLDTVQDKDPDEEEVLISFNQDSLYNLIFAYYVFASSFLDDLSLKEFNPEVLHKLRMMWSSHILRAASGQQKDIISIDDTENISLDSYQKIAQDKTGSIFALAFGGSALLLLDDEPTILALTTAGEIFGTLIQYSDDILDTDQQPNNTLTLPKALQKAYSPSEMASFWKHIYQSHFTHLQNILGNTNQHIKTGIINIFSQAFERNLQ